MTTRKNITQPADWWEYIQKSADEAGLTLSEHIGVMCIPEKVRGKLSARIPAGQAAKVDWSSVDWSKSSAELARELGVSRQTVSAYRPD